MNIRLTFLLVAVLVIFGGTFLVVRYTKTSERPLTQPWLYKIDDDSIIHIEVTHDGKTVNYDRHPGSTEWFIEEEPANVPVFIEKWSGTPLLLSGPRVNRKLSETIDNPSQFGLDPPLTVVKVTERSDIVYEFHIGSETPDGANQYTRLVGAPALFTVPQIWAQVINRLALEPPYPPPEEEQGEATSG
ncbi:MAG: DUF4340 domain-containing protein [Dehalococcoidia bacterium]